MTWRRSRSLPLVLVATVAFTSGVAIGGHVAGSTTSTREPTAPRTAILETEDGSASGVAPSSTVDIDRTAGGAVRTAVALTSAFDGPGLLDERRRERLLDTFVADDARQTLGESLGEVARLITTRLNLDGDDLDHPELVLRSVPAGARVDTFTPDRAVVAIWGTGVVVARGLPLVQPGWRTTEVELAWERNAWRLVAFRSKPGPEPPAVGGTSEAELQARLISEFKPLHHFPAATAGTSS